jgi:hypothetical protein
LRGAEAQQLTWRNVKSITPQDGEKMYLISFQHAKERGRTTGDDSFIIPPEFCSLVDLLQKCHLDSFGFIAVADLADGSLWRNFDQRSYHFTKQNVGKNTTSKYGKFIASKLSLSTCFFVFLSSFFFLSFFFLLSSFFFLLFFLLSSFCRGCRFFYWTLF